MLMKIPSPDRPTAHLQMGVPPQIPRQLSCMTCFLGKSFFEGLPGSDLAAASAVLPQPGPAPALNLGGGGGWGHSWLGKTLQKLSFFMTKLYW